MCCYHESEDNFYYDGHEEGTTGLEKRPDFNMIFSSFVLFVSSFVVVYSISNAAI